MAELGGKMRPEPTPVSDLSPYEQQQADTRREARRQNVRWLKIALVVVLVGVWVPACVMWLVSPTSVRNDTRASTQYTKSGNCGGPSVSTLRFSPEPTAAMFPEAIWFEQCPDGKYYRRIGDGGWTEITKKQADQGASMLKIAGRRVVRVVD